MSDLSAIENNSGRNKNKKNDNINKPFKNLIIITLMLVLLFIATISFLTILICLKVFQLSDSEYLSLYHNNNNNNTKMFSSHLNICTSKSCIRAGMKRIVYVSLIYFNIKNHFFIS
jgi:hypothetical protein